jgi:hypothetical protein
MERLHFKRKVMYVKINILKLEFFQLIQFTTYVEKSTNDYFYIFSNRNK